MQLELLLNELCELAIRNNLVNYAAAGGSIYELNAETIKDYPFIFVSPTDDIEVGQSTITYGFTIFYCDRLLADATNDTQIYSVGVSTLKNFLRQVQDLSYVVNVSDYNVRIFSETHKMADYLNGAYARVRITVLEADCPTYFDETGAPLGTYIPSSIGDINVLENLASKNWVVEYVNEHGGGGGGGVDENEVKRLIRQALTAYTKTEKFATINGSGLTNNERYALLKKAVFDAFLSGYTQDKQDIYEAISASTPEDYEQLRGQVSANTENISTISGATNTNAENISTLSAQTSANTESISSLSAFTSGLSFTVSEQAQAIEQVSGATSGISADLAVLSAATETISGATSDLAGFLADLSGFTYSAVSSTTQEVEALAGAVSALSTGKQDVLTAGDNITIQNNVISAAGNVSSTTIFTLVSISQEDYDLLATKDNNTLYIIR